MKVLGIYGSPRKDGNSDLLLDEVLKGAQEAGAELDRVYCRQLKMSGCLECGGCDETGSCVVQDDMQSVYPKLVEADAIVLSAGIFFYNIPAQAKAVVDRCQARWNERRLRKPMDQWQNYERGRGYMVAVGATKGKNLFEGVELVAKYFYDALDMSYQGGLFYRQMEGKGSIAEHPDALKEAYELGRRIADQKE